jgi:hypothetical protein
LNRSLIAPASHVCRGKKIAQPPCAIPRSQGSTAEHHPDRVNSLTDGLNAPALSAYVDFGRSLIG